VTDALRVYSAANPAAMLTLAHGAGAGQTSAFMIRFARGMADRGITTATFDFPYMAAGRKVPDRTPVLEAAWRAAIESAAQRAGDVPLFIGGKSMGGRIASHVAAQGSPHHLAGLVLLGYPLHPPGRPTERRDAHLPRITVPMLFVQGSRDAFGTHNDIQSLLPSLPRASVHEVPNGDHSFKVPGGATANERAIANVMDTVAAWMTSTLRG
jgi:predicted alpha/beta-hydrolase family hydrolase